MSSTSFELEGPSSGRLLYIQVWYSVFYLLILQYKAHTVCTTLLPDDELSASKLAEDIKN